MNRIFKYFANEFSSILSIQITIWHDILQFSFNWRRNNLNLNYQITIEKMEFFGCFLSDLDFPLQIPKITDFTSHWQNFLSSSTF